MDCYFLSWIWQKILRWILGIPSFWLIDCLTINLPKFGKIIDPDDRLLISIFNIWKRLFAIESDCFSSIPSKASGLIFIAAFSMSAIRSFFSSLGNVGEVGDVVEIISAEVFSVFFDNFFCRRFEIFLNFSFWFTLNLIDS